MYICFFFFLLFFVLSEQLLVITVFISAVLYKVKGFSVVKEFPANVIGCSVSLELESACVHVLWWMRTGNTSLVWSLCFWHRKCVTDDFYTTLSHQECSTGSGALQSTLAWLQLHDLTPPLSHKGGEEELSQSSLRKACAGILTTQRLACCCYCGFFEPSWIWVQSEFRKLSAWNLHREKVQSSTLLSMNAVWCRVKLKVREERTE